MKLQCVFTILICFCIPLSSAGRLTFENVTVRWYNARIWGNVDITTTIKGSNNLAENKPKENVVYPYISIRSQNIPVLYESCLNNLHLDRLELGSCKISDIEIGAFENSTVQSLILTMNKLRTLKRGIFKNTFVQYELRLNKNMLMEIEDGVFDGQVLTSLDLSENNLEEITVGMFKNVVVTKLNLGTNKIKKISKRSFSNMLVLELLHLEHNYIKVVEPGSFQNIPKLKSLILRDNSLEEINNDIFQNISLTQTLDLDENSIKFISPGSFGNSYIKDLTLRNNQLERVEEGIFSDCSGIEKLYLSNNKIKQLGSGSFSNIPGIKVINLENNELDIIENGTFNLAQMGSILTRVDLSGNKLKGIQTAAFIPPSNYKITLDEAFLDEESKKYISNFKKDGHFNGISRRIFFRT